MSEHIILLAAISRTTKVIKLVANHQVTNQLAPQEALFLVSKHPARYTWGGTHNRVRVLIDTTPAFGRPWIPEWAACWRTTGGACSLPPSIEYMNSRRSGV